MRRFKPFARWGLSGLTAVIVIVVNLPIITMILNSLRRTEDILTSTTIIPTHPSLVNYIFVMDRTPYWQFFRNSVIVAAGGMTLIQSFWITTLGKAQPPIAVPYITLLENATRGSPGQPGGAPTGGVSLLSSRVLPFRS